VEKGKKMDTWQTVFTIVFPFALLAVARAYRAWREARQAEEVEAPVPLSPLAEAFARGEAPWQAAGGDEARCIEPWYSQTHSNETWI